MALKCPNCGSENVYDHTIRVDGEDKPAKICLECDYSWHEKEPEGEGE